ncbi:hypothetical protein CAPTEDRAFT_168987 [Capitella teleta]|uniref:Thiamine pyrophosphokinase n=1 Tax=Capitella teleta TaxID=283909 RepID=R7VK53_CAPTE|nr:hypothetical protein CAPTEDRAFT_168987 [Capitella teleta]|eukprot:ELU17046.1 hypothetical protein CAPTEDRAFT_168987 [Capitella teleta]
MVDNSVHGVTEWCPLGCLVEDSNEKIALIKLNTPILDEVSCFKRLWSKAVLKACTDGAINRLYGCKDLDQLKYVPDFISGDFDSAKKEVLEHYRNLGSEIHPTPDQDATDFTKCLGLTLSKLQESNTRVDSIVAHASQWGRFDHVMGNINSLFLAHRMTSIPVYIVSAESLVFLLPKGQHLLHIDRHLIGTHCGLIPIGQVCHQVTTSGLRYNLQQQELKFGELVSTSNAVEDGKGSVYVETDHPLLWTMEINLAALSES